MAALSGAPHAAGDTVRELDARAHLPSSQEDTNYFFDVQGSSLPAALERFAAFFTAPLFTPSATAREVSPVTQTGRR